MTDYLLDVASYQGSLKTSDVVRAGYKIVNLKISHGLGQKAVHPDITGWITRCKAAGLGLATFHFLDNSASGAAQANYAYGRLQALGLVTGTAHIVDCETTATEAIVREYVDTMQQLLGRRIGLYTGDWWWQPKGWNGQGMTPYLHAAPNAGYLGSYPGDTSAHWAAGYGGWPELSIMQFAVEPLDFPDGTSGSIDVSKSALRDPMVWQTLTGGVMAGWVLIDSAIALRSEFNRCGPNRDKGSDGSIGDQAHADSVSDHNPDETGNTGGVEDADSINEVHAIDVDNSGPWLGGFTMEMAVQFLVAECRAGREKRFRYIIYNRRIWSASSGWVQKTYTGASPHTEHAHFSFVYGSGSGASNPENDTSPYGLEGLIDVALDAADKAWLTSTAFTTPIVTAMTKPTALNGPDGKPDGTNSTPVGAAVFNQGLPNPNNDKWGRSRAYTMIGQTAEDTMGIAVLAAAEASRDAAQTALIQQLVDAVNGAGGNLDLAAILAAVDKAANATAAAVIDAMRRAAAAEVTVLEPVADAMTKAVAADPPAGS